MEFETRYGPLYLTRHAIQRWVERTGRSELEMLGACLAQGVQAKASCGGFGSVKRDGIRAESSNVTLRISFSRMALWSPFMKRTIWSYIMEIEVLNTPQSEYASLSTEAALLEREGRYSMAQNVWLMASKVAK